MLWQLYRQLPYQRFSIDTPTDFDSHHLLLCTLFDRTDITVLEVIIQCSAHNLYERSVRFDVLAVDGDGKIYTVEVQRADEGANSNRAKFQNSLFLQARNQVGGRRL